MDRLVEPAPLRAPQKSGEILVAPSWRRAGDLLEANRAAREDWDYDVQGIPLGDLARAARQEVLQAAREYTLAYASGFLDSLDICDAERPIFFAGHQPELFHPGVWLKNFALGSLAETFAGVGINLIIDADDVRTTDIRVPTGEPDAPRVATIPYDLPLEPQPYEERPVRDRSTFESFGRTAADALNRLVNAPILEEYWPLACERSREANLGQAIAQARHLVERAWGSRTLELPQSRLCRLPSIRTLICHLLAHLPRLHEVYNGALEGFRMRHGLRNHAQPMPNLESSGRWLEAPLWTWSSAAPTRRRVFVQSSDEKLELSDRRTWSATLPLSADSDPQAAIDRLEELERQGIKIRSRALVTTLLARVLCSDVFIHGIGGARYDEVNDELIREFFRCAPPQFMAISGTLHLPIAAESLSFPEARSWKQRLRDLRYHPERHLPAVAFASGPARGRAESLAEEKRHWIDIPKTPVNAHRRHTAIVQANRQLQPYVAPLREEATLRLEEARKAERTRQILQSRDYAFCLYPREALRSLLFSLTAVH